MNANNPTEPNSSVQDRKRRRREAIRWWLKLGIQPLLFLAAGAILLAGLGIAQRAGWISSGSIVSDAHSPSTDSAEDVLYICPMMCTPPQSEPGRCPVCAMELVPAASGGGDSEPTSIQIDPVARRVANIQTAPVESMPVTREIRAVGELSYDEGTLKTLAAYVDGRLERLFADYTGVVVSKGDHLALLYSPPLYSGQVELLLAKKARDEGPRTTLAGVNESRHSLYQSARQRLSEFGMTEDQIGDLERTGQASSRLPLCAPISGTVIEKLAVEGQYVKEGMPIYRLADLSSLWLMLELFPEDAATVHYGQQVEAEVQSFPGRKFTGRVAFIDPNVNPLTRTVGVRVVMPNTQDILRVGDYAKAVIEVPVNKAGARRATIYDPELANKWISPRHPQVITDAPGACPVCGIGLVPASEFGFSSTPINLVESLVVPRSAVLMAGGSSVVYVETEPGRFELRPVTLGPCCGERIVIASGVELAEQVATNGNFLIDSQMQLTGKPSLIDPTKGAVADEGSGARGQGEKIAAALSALSSQDRQLAERQRICPVTKMPLGSMGVPVKVEIEGRTVLLCCGGCEAPLREDSAKYLTNLAAAASVSDETDGQGLPGMELPEMDFPIMALPEMGVPQPTDVEQDNADIARALALLTPADRQLVEVQRICPVTEMPLGSMGVPLKVDVSGRTVFICCEGCRESLLANPAKYLAVLRREATK